LCRYCSGRMCSRGVAGRQRTPGPVSVEEEVCSPPAGDSGTRMHGRQWAGNMSWSSGRREACGKAELQAMQVNGPRW